LMRSFRSMEISFQRKCLSREGSMDLKA
jgi:hypothetical protein